MELNELTANTFMYTDMSANISRSTKAGDNGEFDKIINRIFVNALMEDFVKNLSGNSDGVNHTLLLKDVVTGFIANNLQLFSIENIEKNHAK